MTWKLPSTRRNHDTFTDTRGKSCCWTPPENSQIHGRLCQPFNRLGFSVVAGTELPNAAFRFAPHSPFAAGFVRSQSGMKFLLPSFQLRVVLAATVVAGDRKSTRLNSSHVSESR